jgi:energy-coupling factor transporter ATP-binding protein EcfA2
MWRERGLTMVLVTHDSSIARRAQRIGVMKNGRLGFRQPRPGEATWVQATRTVRAGPQALPWPDLGAEDFQNLDRLDLGDSDLEPADIITFD